MKSTLRLIDGGTAEGRWQIAVGAALIAEHATGATPATLRIFRMPPTVLIGRHQAIWDSIRLEDCLADGIALARRITGGGATFADHHVLGWEALIDRDRVEEQDLGRVIVAVAQAARGGLKATLGDDPFPVGSVSGLFEGSTLAVQGFLRFASAAEPDITYLNHEPEPSATHRFRSDAPDIAQIFTGLATGLATAWQLTPEAGALTPSEAERTQRHYESDIGTDEFVFTIDDPLETGLRIASHKASASEITVYLRTAWVDGVHRTVEALITGDFIMVPARRIADLETALGQVPVSELSTTIDRFFAGMDLYSAGATSEDFKSAILAAAKAEPTKSLLPVR